MMISGSLHCILTTAASKTTLANTASRSRRLWTCSLGTARQQVAFGSSSFQHKTTTKIVAVASFPHRLDVCGVGNAMSNTYPCCFFSTQSPPTDAVDSPPVAKLKDIMREYRQQK
jgi:hypothetical protein